MPSSLYVSPRTFRVWLYTVSHSTLLLRSVKGEGHSTRVDVIFKSVRHMIIPSSLPGLDIRLVAPGFPDELPHEIRAYAAEDKIYSLSGERGGAWIIAGTVGWHEDDGEYGDPSHFSVPRMVWEAP